MGANRITLGGAVLRGLWIAALLGVLGLALAACGSGGDGGATVTVTQTTAAAPEVDEEADAEVLGEVLDRQSGAVAAYERTLPHLQGERRATALLFLAQEQEHIDGLLKLFRGLGEPAQAEPETIEAQGLKSELDYVLFLYELENATIELELAALGRLTSPTARTTLVTTIANQAQHLVLLRRSLGADLAESVPVPFEIGAAPSPSVRMDE
jgi:hypothetical protein